MSDCDGHTVRLVKAGEYRGRRAVTGKLYTESEHQEAFLGRLDLSTPITVHIPSAIAVLGYGLYLRVAAADAKRCQTGRVSVQLNGLKSDDVEVAFGEGIEGPGNYPSSEEGLVWVAWARVFVSRGTGILQFSGLPTDLPPAELLLCTWPRFVEGGQADDWLACQTDPHWAPNGVPLGGLGCGKVELSRDGRFRNFSGNNNQDMPFEEPDGLEGAYLSVTVDGEERLLATRSMAGIQPALHLEAELLLPRATLTAREVFPGIDVCVDAVGSLVPHDLELSSLPGFLLRWTVTNRRREPAKVVCKLAWPNLVGSGGGIARAETQTGYGDGSYLYWEAPSEAETRVVEGDGFQALVYSNRGSGHDASADGRHFVAIPSGGDFGGNLSSGESGWGAVNLTVPAGDCVSTDMAVVWDMPRWIDSLGIDRGHYWQNHCRDGLEVVAKLLNNRDKILIEGSALTDLLLGTDLPPPIASRMANCCYPLVTNSVFYRDGRFSINEGPTEMSGCYGTLDQRLAAHPATLLWFPELNARELLQFAGCQAENGGMQHELGYGHLEHEPGELTWPDLTCSFILQTARHAWTLGDRDFDEAAWPSARKAFLRHRTWAEAGGGVAQVGDGLGTSYDGYHYEGTTPYMATLWIASLLVMDRWAEIKGDETLLASIPALLDRALDRMDRDLWNGTYYQAYARAGGAVDLNSHVGMLAGEVFARLLAGRDVVPRDRLLSCAETLLDCHGREEFVAPPDEVTPDGEAATDYGWLPYVEGFGLTAAALALGDRILPLWSRVLRVMEDEGRRPCETRLMYRPLTGEPAWGAYYMTAPASWLVYDALLDFKYEPLERTLRLNPAVEGRFPIVHPLFWAVGERVGDAYSIRVVRVFSADPIYVEFVEWPTVCQGALRYETVQIGKQSIKEGESIHVPTE